MRRKEIVSHSFYPLTTDVDQNHSLPQPMSARVAVYTDSAAAPHVIAIDSQPIRPYLEEITQVVSDESLKLGGSIPFMIIRECVENLIHAYFKEPVISIYDQGNTIKISDLGPGIANKELAKTYGATSATQEMKQFIRGTGSGLPYVEQYLTSNGGTLLIEDNVNKGCIVTLTLHSAPSPHTSFALRRRSQQILKFLQTNPEVGPKKLAELYGSSLPTWSRELQILQNMGLLQKGSQKYFLTSAGSSLLSQLLI